VSTYRFPICHWQLGNLLSQIKGLGFTSEGERVDGHPEDREEDREEEEHHEHRDHLHRPNLPSIYWMSAVYLLMSASRVPIPVHRSGIYSVGL
jgi:hypothetical protein